MGLEPTTFCMARLGSGFAAVLASEGCSLGAVHTTRTRCRRVAPTSPPYATESLVALPRHRHVRAPARNRHVRDEAALIVRIPSTHPWSGDAGLWKSLGGGKISCVLPSGST
jgi:hypothetical protein